VGIWEVYNGTAWVAATNYPGQVAGTNDVSIIGGESVTLNSTIPNSFNSLSIGSGELLLTADSSLDTPLVTLNTGGTIEWTSNNIDLALPANASIILNGGNLVEDKPCSANKTITIGSNVYASCNGGGGSGIIGFDVINAGGGTIAVTPSANSPVCIGTDVNLMANPSGADSDAAGTSISWNGSGPGGYTFSSSLENPVINTTGFTAGTYTYTVTITDPNSNSDTESIDVIMGISPDPPVSGGNQTICVGNPISPLTVTVNAGETADWYSVPTGGTSILDGNTSFTPLTGGSYFAEARNIVSGCVSITRTEITLTISGCKIITNRRTTFRVKQ